MHDTLTGLPNRALLNERLQQLMDQAGNDAVSVLFIELDQFRKINASLGQAPGDCLLRQVALRLRASLRSDATVARLGSGEFVAVIPCPAGPSAAAEAADCLLAVLAAPFDLGITEVSISASIGLAMYPADASSRNVLFQHADAAMQRAKASGRNTWCFFEAKMPAEAHNRMLLEQALHRALERGEFELHYQPYLNLRSMTVAGIEALLRWNHPRLGRLAPQDFIPMAEQIDLMNDIGNWTLQQACMQAGRLQRQLGRALRVSVNLSAWQWRHLALPERVGTAIEVAGLAPQSLELELGESALADDIDGAQVHLAALKASGARIAIHDFGTAGWTLACLQRLPVDIIKLVPASDCPKPGFVKALVELAHARGIEVIAGGIENMAMRDPLQAAGCDYAQGYLFAPPMPLAECQLFLTRMPRLFPEADTRH